MLSHIDPRLACHWQEGLNGVVNLMPEGRSSWVVHRTDHAAWSNLATSCQITKA